MSIAACRHPWRLPVFLFFFVWHSSGLGATNDNAYTPLTVPTNLWIQVGEEMTYRIYWGKIPVGSTRVWCEWTEENGRKLLAIRYRTRSNKIVATLYPVDDFIEALIDPATFRSVRFTKKLSEGSHRYDETTTFDYEALTAHWESKLSQKKRELKLDHDTRDLVAYMYLMRGRPFQQGETIRSRVMADDKIYDIWVRVGAVEDIELPNYGNAPSVRLDPEAAFEGIFVRKGKLTAWVSNDERRLCTRIVGSVPVANINVLLVNVKGPGNDFWIQHAKP